MENLDREAGAKGQACVIEVGWFIIIREMPFKSSILVVRRVYRN